MKNPMQSPGITKVTINISVGESGDKLIKAEELLKKLTNRTPVRTTSKHKLPTWGLRKGEAIGCKVTLRGAEAIDFLQRSLQAKDNKLKASSFDKEGNFSFGVGEYIDIKGMKYDPEIGIFGMDVCVTVERPGYRLKRRKLETGTYPRKSRLTKEESIDFIKEKLGVQIE